MKKLITTFAAAGILGLAGCAAEENDAVILDDPVLEETSPPVISEPVAPLGVDTMTVDTLAPSADTAPVTPPATPQ